MSTIEIAPFRTRLGVLAVAEKADAARIAEAVRELLQAAPSPMRATLQAW